MLRLKLTKHPSLWGRYRSQVFRLFPCHTRVRLHFCNELLCAITIGGRDVATFVDLARIPELPGPIPSPYRGKGWRPLEEQVQRLSHLLETTVYVDVSDVPELADRRYVQATWHKPRKRREVADAA